MKEQQDWEEITQKLRVTDWVDKSNKEICKDNVAKDCCLALQEWLWVSRGGKNRKRRDKQQGNTRKMLKMLTHVEMANTWLKILFFMFRQCCSKSNVSRREDGGCGWAEAGAGLQWGRSQSGLRVSANHPYTQWSFHPPFVLAGTRPDSAPCWEYLLSSGLLCTRWRLSFVQVAPWVMYLLPLAETRCFFQGSAL